MILILPECWFSRAIVFFLLDTAYCKLKQVFLKIRKISRKKKLKYHKEYILKISAQSIGLLRNNSYDKFNDITWVSMLCMYESKSWSTKSKPSTLYMLIKSTIAFIEYKWLRHYKIVMIFCSITKLGTEDCC